MGFFSSISHAVSSVGKKVSGAVDTAVKVGKKVSGEVGSVAKKVSSVSGAVSKGLAVAGGVAAAVGLEPIAGALEAGAGAAKAVSAGAAGVGDVAGKVSKGLDRVADAKSAITNTLASVSAGGMKKQDAPVSSQTTTQKSIERGKDVRQQVVAPAAAANRASAPPLNFQFSNKPAVRNTRKSKPPQRRRR